MDREGSAQAGGERVRRLSALVEQMVGGTERELLEATAELRAELVETEARYSDLSLKVEQQKTFDLCAMQSEAQIAAALGSVVEMEQANQTRLEFLLAFPARMKQQVRATRSVRAEAFIEGFEGGFASASEVADLEGQILARMRELLELIGREWGRWSCNDAGEMEMQSEAAAERFTAVATSVAELGEKQVALQKSRIKAQLELLGDERPAISADAPGAP
jgi:hypothetical protein